MCAKDGNFALAGELFAKAGDKKRAAAAFEKANQYDSAIFFYRELNEKAKVAELLAKLERYLEAADEYIAQGLLDEALKVCQKVEPKHQDCNKAQALMGFVFRKKR